MFFGNMFFTRSNFHTVIHVIRFYLVDPQSFSRTSSFPKPSPILRFFLHYFYTFRCPSTLNTTATSSILLIPRATSSTLLLIGLIRVTGPSIVISATSTIIISSSSLLVILLLESSTALKCQKGLEDLAICNTQQSKTKFIVFKS